MMRNEAKITSETSWHNFAQICGIWLPNPEPAILIWNSRTQEKAFSCFPAFQIHIPSDRPTWIGLTGFDLVRSSRAQRLFGFLRGFSGLGVR
jgi:hypothetical protein